MSSTTASITKRSVTGSFYGGRQGVRRDGGSVITGRSLSVLVEDDVTLSGGSASFAEQERRRGQDRHRFGVQLAGDDKANYALGTIGTATASITKREVTGRSPRATRSTTGRRQRPITRPVAEWRRRRG
jgi:hypothetical protein